MDVRAGGARFARRLALLGALVVLAGCTGLPFPQDTSALGSHAIAWVAQDGAGIAQVWASIDDEAPRQITHRGGPAPACGHDVLGAPMFAPDLRHIAVATGNTCGDGQIAGKLLVVDATNGDVSTVPLPGPGSVLTDQRSYGWLDDGTLFAVGDFGGDAGGVTYALGDGAATPLDGLPAGIPEAVARGQTLFYVTADRGSDGAYMQYHVTLHQYDLGGHMVLPDSVDLGAFDLCACSTGDDHWQGWDVSPDGKHVAFEWAKPGKPSSATTGLASEKMYYANADGSGATEIVKAMQTQSRVRLRFSPNGAMIGVTEAPSSPDVLSGCVNTPGLYGDPCMQFYGPDATGYPAWHYDSAYMIARAAPTSPDQLGSLYRYTLSRFHGVRYAANGYNCWSTP